MKRLFVGAENAEFQIIESLKNNRAKRAQAGEIFVEGIESIKRALEARAEITRIITAKKISSWAEGVIGRLGSGAESANPHGNAPRIIEMPDGLYRKLCDRGDPSEMLVTAKMPSVLPAELALPERPFILVLDRISDTGNLGSIIRSANSFGVDAVLLLGHSVDPWDPKTIRASLGSVFFTVPARLESLAEFEEFISTLKSTRGVEIWGTDSGGDVSAASGVLKRPLALVLGNEAKGMSRALKAMCRGIISIPMRGAVNSLNLANAASIFMWEVVKSDGPIFPRPASP